MGPYGPEFDRVQEDDARFVARAKRAFVGLLGLSRDTYGLQSTTARSEMRRGIDEALGLVADPRSSIQVEMQKRPDFIVAGLGTLTVNNEEERPGPGSRGILLTPSSDIGDKSSGFAEGTDEDGGYLAALEEGLEGNELDNPYFAKRKRDRRGSLSNTGLGVLDGGEKEEREPAPKDLADAVIAAFQSPYFNEPLTARVDYRRSRKAREHRLRKYKSVVGSDDPFILSQQDGNSQIIAENIVANNKKLAMRGEQHRGLAVLLAMRYRDPNKRAKLMEKFDEAARNNTREIVRRVKAGEELDYDIVIRGGGEYAAAAAQHIRELAPDLKIFVADKNDHVGGQFADYGPFPAFRMNSRARVGGRYLPYVPRTDGDINSQGPFAILSLSDLQDETYAFNTVRGDMTKMAVTIVADDITINTVVGDQKKLPNGRFDVPMQTSFEGEELEYNVRASVVIDARGLRQESTIAIADKSLATPENGYYTTADAYRLFGGKYDTPGQVHDPMAVLDGKVVEIDGFSDGGKTLAELLVRAMPPETYGPRRRKGPSEIRVVNAPGLFRDAIVATLRSRYAGYFPQSLPKSPGDPGGLLSPLMGKAISHFRSPNGVWYTNLEDDRALYADVKFDTTNGAVKIPPDDTPGVLSISPAFHRKTSTEAEELLDALGVGDNTDAFWFKVPGALTDSEKAIDIALAARNR